MTFQDDMDRLFAEAVAVGAVHGAHCAMRSDLPGSMSMTCTCREPGPLGLLDYGIPRLIETPAITVHKHSAFVPMTLDQLADSGAISEADARAQGWTPYVPPPVPWSRRLRWRWQAWRERTGRKIGGWIAGEDLSERDEDW